MANTQQQTDLDVLMECVRWKYEFAFAMWARIAQAWHVYDGPANRFIASGPTEFDAALAAADVVLREEGYTFTRKNDFWEWWCAPTNGSDFADTRSLAIIAAARDSRDRSQKDARIEITNGVIAEVEIARAGVERVSGEGLDPFLRGDRELIEHGEDGKFGYSIVNHKTQSVDGIGDTPKDAWEAAERNTRPAPAAAPAEGERNELTPAVFATMMQAELDANAHKGDWRDWHPSINSITSELDHHALKLRRAINSQDRVRVTEHSADVANVCMKAAERFGMPSPAPTPQGGTPALDESGSVEDQLRRSLRHMVQVHSELERQLATLTAEHQALRDREKTWTFQANSFMHALRLMEKHTGVKADQFIGEAAFELALKTADGSVRRG